MEKYRIKLLTAWVAALAGGSEETHKEGTILKVDEKTRDELIQAGTAKSYSEDEEKAEKEAEAKRKAEMKQFFGEVLEESLKANRELANENGGGLINIQVGKDLKLSDPWGGYMPGQTLSGEYSNEAKQFAASAFMADVYLAASNGGQPGERLKTAMERSSEMIEKSMKYFNPELQAEHKASMALGGNQGIGFLMPAAMSQMLLAPAALQSVVRPRAMTMDMETRELSMPYMLDKDRSSDILYGGVAAYYTGEEEKYQESEMKLSAVDLRLNKLTCLGYITDEVRRYSPVSAGSFLFPAFAQAIAWKQDLMYLFGGGAGTPLGIFSANNPALVVVPKETSPAQSAGTFVEMNILKMFSRLRTTNDRSVGWVTNRQNIPDLATIVDANGNRLWVNANAGGKDALSYAPLGTLMGYDVGFNEKMELTGTQGDLGLADYSQYIIADDRKGPEAAQSIHIKFDEGKTAYRLTTFNDGRPARKEKLTPKKGQDISPYLVLAART